jgi:hypothetical protein
MGEPAFRADPRVGREGDLSQVIRMIAPPKPAGVFSRSRRFYSILEVDDV